MKKLLATLAAAGLVATAVAPAALAVEDANLPVKIDEKTGVISSNGPVDVPTAGEKGEVYPTHSGEATEGKGPSNIEYKGNAKLDKDGNLEYVYDKGPANTQEALPELSKEDAAKLAKQDEEKDPSLKKSTPAKKDATKKAPAAKKTGKTLPKTSAVK